MEQNTADLYDHTIVLDTAIYPLEGVQMAARSFIDEAFFHLRGEEPQGRIKTVSLAVKPRDPHTDLSGFMGRFYNEMNRQCLRIHSNRRNRKIRMQIIGRALASARNPGEETDPVPARNGDSGAAETSSREDHTTP